MLFIIITMLATLIAIFGTACIGLLYMEHTGKESKFTRNLMNRLFPRDGWNED